MIKKHTYRLLFALMALLLVQSRAIAQKLNYELVSMYVYNFTKYIEWPADKTKSDFVVGVYGNSPLTPMLNKYVSAKHVGQRSIVIKQLSPNADVGNCAIVFVPESQNSKIKQLSEQLKGKPVLIVAEKYGMAKKGAGISIYLDEDDEDKTKFEVSKTSITQSGLIISNNLLRLASQVY